jgi:hypothetical protein
MFSRLGRVTTIGFIIVALTALAMGCSSDNPVTSTLSSDDVTNEKTPGGFTPSLAAPAEGIVIEGVSVPGIALGSTRAQVEDAYGDQLWCQGPNQSFCAFPVSGGGQVDVHYRGTEGGEATNSADDVVFKITWHEAVSGWVTTAGINTRLAKESPEDVISAYPNARVTYNGFGGIYSVVDYDLGIEVRWVADFYHGTTHVNMAIFSATEPPPVQEKIIRVANIDLTAKKTKGKRQVRALVKVENQATLAASGANVFAIWTLPNGSTQAVNDATSAAGYAYFEIIGGARGTYTLTVEDVVLDGYAFDGDNSVLSASVTAK